MYRYDLRRFGLKAGGNPQVNRDAIVNAWSTVGDGAQLLLPPGTVDVNPLPQQPSGVTLCGHGSGVTEIALVDNAPVGSHVMHANGASDIGLRGLTLNGNKGNQVQAGLQGARYENVNGLLIDDVEFRDCVAEGVYVDASTRVRVGEFTDHLNGAYRAPKAHIHARNYAAYGNGADEEVELQAAIDALEPWDGGQLDLDAVEYLVGEQLNVRYGGITFQGLGVGADTAVAGQTSLATTKITCTGADDMTIFDVQSATPGNRLFDVRFRDMMILGAAAGAAKAGKGIHATNFTRCVVEHVAIQRCRIAGIHLDADGLVSTDAWIFNYLYIWGSQTAQPEAVSDALLIHPRPAGGGVTQVKALRCGGSVYDGNGVHIKGSSDNCNFYHSGGSIQSGGSGYSVRFSKDTGSGQPRRHVFWYTAGGVFVDSDCVGSRFEHHIAEEGDGPASDEAFHLEAGATVHYSTIDYQHNDLFVTHRYLMADEEPVRWDDTRVNGGAFETALASYGKAWNVSAGSDGGCTFQHPGKFAWSNGELTGLRIHYGITDDTDTDAIWNVEVGLMARQPGSNFAAVEHIVTQDITLPSALHVNGVYTAVVDLTGEPVTYERGDIIHARVRRRGQTGEGPSAPSGAIKIADFHIIYKGAGPDSAPTKQYDVPDPYTA